MQLKVYKSLWGMTGTVRQQMEQIANAGYDGVESACDEIIDVVEFRELLQEYQLEYIPLIYTERHHRSSFKRLLELALSYAPRKVVAHAGRDVMTFTEQVQFFEYVLRLEAEMKIPVAHETHRRRPLFSPMNASALLKELPELQINLDLSHWCCVTESLLEDHQEVVAGVIERSIHCHARVGYENGPQVPDPRAQEWEAHQGRFERWWEKYLQTQKRYAREVCTVTPEYGPPSYMHTNPRTGEPVADLWQICLWTNDRIRILFETL